MAAPIKSLLLLFFLYKICDSADNFPIVINTWPFTNATDKAWSVINTRGLTPVDAVEAGCSQCEREQCDGTVGYGGSPDETGETTLDALIMDGKTHDVGSVGGLRRVRNAIAVARAVMEFTKHTLLVGDAATSFAKEMGFVESDLHTNKSKGLWNAWKLNKCQPNYRQNVFPDPRTSCGPYNPDKKQVMISNTNKRYSLEVSEHNHDTIGMIVIDKYGNVAGGTSSNGANHKVPGRVGDSPIAGAGAYVDNNIGGAAATGDGDVMMRFLPSYQVVESMRLGVSPVKAAKDAINRIASYYPSFMGAIVAVNKKGEIGAACNGFSSFPYSVRMPNMSRTSVFRVACSGAGNGVIGK